MSEVTGIFFYLIFLSVCLFTVPLWSWFKGKRKVTAVALAMLGVAFGYFIFGYFEDPQTTEDHGTVVFGFIFFVPPFVLLLHLFIYGVIVLVHYIRTKRSTA